jgi:hypothetical protein
MLAMKSSTRNGSGACCVAAHSLYYGWCVLFDVRPIARILGCNDVIPKQSTVQSSSTDRQRLILNLPFSNAQYQRQLMTPLLTRHSERGKPSQKRIVSPCDRLGIWKRSKRVEDQQHDGSVKENLPRLHAPPLCRFYFSTLYMSDKA